MRNNIWHVTPINDLKPHTDRTIKKRNGVVVSKCKCNPRIKYQEDNSVVVIHASYDGREAMEEVNAILNPKE